MLREPREYKHHRWYVATAQAHCKYLSKDGTITEGCTNGYFKTEQEAFIARFNYLLKENGMTKDMLKTGMITVTRRGFLYLAHCGKVQNKARITRDIYMPGVIACMDGRTLRNWRT